MKMSISCFLCLIFFSFLSAQERTECKVCLASQGDWNKTFFLNNPWSQQKVNLSSDLRGLYFFGDSIYGECPYGHPAVNDSGQCDFPNCPYSRRND
jgi:hypothetical protein